MLSLLFPAGNIHSFSFPLSIYFHFSFNKLLAILGVGYWIKIKMQKRNSEGIGRERGEIK